MDLIEIQHRLAPDGIIVTVEQFPERWWRYLPAVRMDSAPRILEQQKTPDDLTIGIVTCCLSTGCDLPSPYKDLRYSIPYGDIITMIGDYGKDTRICQVLDRSTGVRRIVDLPSSYLIACPVVNTPQFLVEDNPSTVKWLRGYIET